MFCSGVSFDTAAVVDRAQLAWVDGERLVNVYVDAFPHCIFVTLGACTVRLSETKCENCASYARGFSAVMRGSC